ncbi:MAG TPA: SufD family Fe-S cluster assembly protein, partial [Fibrobacteraceae bacterium]|nr:SufD family Fe-S cluster assembly protein [Fibrobacteraceae bacterium]
LNGEDSTVDFRLLNQLKGETEAHYHLTIHHNAPHTKNNQFVRQILNSKSHVSYDGAVHVEKDCTEVNSAQLINSILLSEEAKVSVKPVLKIYHDDVECTHGNTCGELDAESLYYLQSRGIDAKKAEEILLLNFASEVFSDLESSIGRERILHILANKN